MTPTLYKLKTKEFRIYINKDSGRYEVFGVKEFKKIVTTIKRRTYHEIRYEGPGRRHVSPN